MAKIIVSKIQIKRGTEAQWLTVNPILSYGELAYVDGVIPKLKIGNGIDTFSNLIYIGGDANITSSDDVPEGIINLYYPEIDKNKIEFISITSPIDLDSVNLHLVNQNNPHNITKTQIGLGNVDNTADLDKPISNLTQQELTFLNESFIELDEQVDILITEKFTEAERIKLQGIEPLAQVNDNGEEIIAKIDTSIGTGWKTSNDITIDVDLNILSENPVQNSAVTERLALIDNRQSVRTEISFKSQTSTDLATVTYDTDYILIYDFNATVGLNYLLVKNVTDNDFFTAIYNTKNNTVFNHNFVESNDSGSFGNFAILVEPLSLSGLDIGYKAFALYDAGTATYSENINEANITVVATNYGDIVNHAKAVTYPNNTGSVLNLIGTQLATNSANATTTYTIGLTEIGGQQIVRINAATEPTVTGATKISSPTFQPNTDMYMTVINMGYRTEYFFTKITD